MPSARTYARSGVKSTVPPKVFKRSGSISNAEKALVSQFVQDQPCALTTSQVNGLAKTLRRSREAVRDLIAEVQEGFIEAAPRYVEIHRLATEAALAHGSVGGLEVAQKGAQWFIEKASIDGKGIIEKATSAPTGTRIMIGVRIGGTKEVVESVVLPVVEGSTVE